MKGPGLTAVAMALAFTTCAVPEAAADLWKVTGLSATPTNVADGSKVTVKCSYKMTLEEKDDNDLQVIVSDNGTVKKFANVSYSHWQGGSHTTSYSIQGGGSHAIKCALKSINLTTLNGKVTDEKTVFVTVTTKSVTPGGDWPKSTPRAYIKDQKSGNVQVNPNPIPPPKP